MNETVSFDVLGDVSQDYYVYMVKNDTGKIEFAGIGRIADIFSLKAIRTNEYYKPMMKYEICLFKDLHFKNKFDALRSLNSVMYNIIKGTPRMNVHGCTHNRNRRIFCETTGEMFDNASDICRKYNINNGQLSQHLKGMDGYKLVHGMRFLYESEHLKKQEMEKLVSSWTVAMFKIPPLEWTVDNTGLSQETFDKCVREYYSQEMFVHPLDDNEARKSLTPIKL